MMRRAGSLFLLLSLVVTAAAPLAGERLLCAMPMRTAAGSQAAPTCVACAMVAPAQTAASLEAASCCRTAPATEAENVPATMSAPRRGGGPAATEYAPAVAAIASCPEIAGSATAFASSPPIPASSPPLRSTQTTHLRN